LLCLTSLDHGCPRARLPTAISYHDHASGSTCFCVGHDPGISAPAGTPIRPHLSETAQHSWSSGWKWRPNGVSRRFWPNPAICVHCHTQFEPGSILATAWRVSNKFIVISPNYTKLGAASGCRDETSVFGQCIHDKPTYNGVDSFAVGTSIARRLIAPGTGQQETYAAAFVAILSIEWDFFTIIANIAIVSRISPSKTVTRKV